MTSPPLVTLSLVTYNGERWLDACLESVTAQTCGDFELIVLDNGSTDGSAATLARWASIDDRLRNLPSTGNVGYAAGHNRVIDVGRGRYVCLLNQDVVLADSFLDRALAAFDDDRVGAVQAKVCRLSGDLQRLPIIDTTGLVMHRNRRVTSRGQGQPDGDEYTLPGEVFGVDGACPVYRTDALRDARVPRGDGSLEILDEDFFMYKEDVDLAWRLQLLGWRTRYEPAAAAWHGRTAGESAASTVREVVAQRRRIPRWIKASSWKNQRLMQLKNEVTSEFFRDAPTILVKELMALGYLVAFSPRSLGVVRALFRQLPAARAKRRHIQRRRVSPGISAWLT